MFRKNKPAFAGFTPPKIRKSMRGCRTRSGLFHDRSVLLFLLPGLLLLMIFYVIPFFSGISYSVTDGSKANTFVGLKNYEALWQNKMFLLGLKNTLELSVISAPLLWVASFFLALMLMSIQPKGTFFRSASLLPYLAPSSAILLVWLILFDYGGPLNRIADMLGVERVMWLESAALRMPIILMFIWKNLGFCMVIFLAALQTVPQSLYEYATLEGGGFFTKAFKVALPHILPTAFLVFVLAWINAFKIFKEVYVIAGSYPDTSVYTLQHYMNNMFSRLDYQMVTAAAYSFAVIVLALFAVLFILQRRAAQ